MVAKKKRRHRKRSYHTGTHRSTKTGKECNYRSGWELAYMRHLDADDDVITWLYEPFIIRYVSNKRTGRMRSYHPDFLVIRADGITLEEVKPRNKLTKPTVKKKLEAAIAWCEVNGMRFDVITESELKDLDII